MDSFKKWFFRCSIFSIAGFVGWTLGYNYGFYALPACMVFSIFIGKGLVLYELEKIVRAKHDI